MKEEFEKNNCLIYGIRFVCLSAKSFLKTRNGISDTRLAFRDGFSSLLTGAGAPQFYLAVKTSYVGLLVCCEAP